MHTDVVQGEGATVEEQELTGPVAATLYRPRLTPGVVPGVVVVSGSSGRRERERARLFAENGAAAMALDYFGGPGQPPGICEVPLETITAGIDLLAELGHEPISLVGTSKGAEAALVVASLDTRVGAVVAIAPSSVVWANVGAGLDGKDRPLRSSWSWQGRPVPFVPYDPKWQPVYVGGQVAFRGYYEQSLEVFADEARAAAIPVERTTASLVLLAGGDDRVWPSDRFAIELAGRAAGKVALHVAPTAGHRITLPGETPTRRRPADGSRRRPERRHPTRSESLAEHPDRSPSHLTTGLAQPGLMVPVTASPKRGLLAGYLVIGLAVVR